MADTLFCVLHVPKCAGSTIEAHLHKGLGSKGFWRPAKRTRNFPLELLGRKYEWRLPGPANEIKAISGHFIGSSIERRFPGRSVKRTILLRRPADLMLSWYNYRMMRYIAGGQAPYPFRLHLRSMPFNPVAHFLLERWLEMPLWKTASMSEGRKARLLDATLSEFDFIGDIGDCDRLIAKISAELGIDGNAMSVNTEHDWLRRVEWAPLRYDQLDADDRASIADATRLDDYLWRRWALKEPVSFEPKHSSYHFLGRELTRPYYEVQRRYQRRHRSNDHAQWQRRGDNR